MRLGYLIATYMFYMTYILTAMFLPSLILHTNRLKPYFSRCVTIK